MAEVSRRVSLMSDDRQYMHATLQSDFILDVLRDVLPTTGAIREIAKWLQRTRRSFCQEYPKPCFPTFRS
jgi:hypothetical protein